MITVDAIRARFDEGHMSSLQRRAVALTAVLGTLDGYDVFSVTFAAPAITAAWGIGRAELGVVLSAGLAGMALGSFLIAPVADLLGRKRTLLISVSLMALGMLFSAFARGLGGLSICRLVTGVGIGTTIAVINPLAAEFANRKSKAFTIAVMSTGYPVGGLVGGVLAAFLIRAFGWQAVFLAGSAASVILLPLIAWVLPESPAFLLASKRPDRLARINDLLVRCGHPAVDGLEDCEPARSRGYAVIFAADRLPATAWATLVNLLFVITVYYVLSWLPQMVADAGFGASQASLVSSTASLVGIGACPLLGWLALRASLRWLTTTMLICFGLATLALGRAPASLPLLIVAAGFVGFFVFGAGTVVNATIATSFGDEARASGTGFVMGVGRVGSAAAPLAAGWLFAGGFGRSAVSGWFGAFSMFAGLILTLGWRRFRRE